MHEKSRMKYVLVILICFSIFIYGFIKINITKSELVRKKSGFTIELKFKPMDLRIETKDYVFYVNSKIFHNLKEKYVDAYNNIFER